MDTLEFWFGFLMGVIVLFALIVFDIKGFIASLPTKHQGEPIKPGDSVEMHHNPKHFER